MRKKNGRGISGDRCFSCDRGRGVSEAKGLAPMPSSETRRETPRLPRTQTSEMSLLYVPSRNEYRPERHAVRRCQASAGLIEAGQIDQRPATVQTLSVLPPKRRAGVRLGRPGRVHSMPLGRGRPRPRGGASTD